MPIQRQALHTEVSISTLPLIMPQFLGGLVEFQLALHALDLLSFPLPEVDGHCFRKAAALFLWPLSCTSSSSMALSIATVALIVTHHPFIEARVFVTLIS
jgi:hypothetical protein